MSDEKKTKEDEKDEQTEEEQWDSVDELLVEISKTHFSETSYRGKTIRVAWKELDDDDSIEEIETFPVDTQLNKKDERKLLSDIVEKTTLAMIKKAGTQENCFNKNKIDEKTWKAIPYRIRAQLISDVLDTKRALEKRFQ